ncbi:MAG: response regulator transcription factor [Bacteroidia bacterium]|nr:response regulator transcription factor [Bacteroidia bacterium]
MNEITKTPANILIVDDHQMFIDGVKLLLRKAENFNVVAEAINGKQAIDIIRNCDGRNYEINLVITDISMPEMSGVELTRLIKEEFPHIKVLVLTMYNDREIVNEIINSEAEGYILKNTGKKELIEAINRILDNGTYYSNEVVAIMMEHVKSEKKQAEQTKALTPRELEIIQLICQEYSTAEIAEKLFLSPLTVETHRKHILRKTNSKTIVGLIKFAIKNNLF